MRLATTTLVFCVAALSALGLVMIFSASTATPQARYLFWQPIWCGIGFVAFLVAASSNYTWLKKFSWIPWVLLGAAILLLALTLFTPKINGARRWLGHGGFRFQPSEVAKLAVIITLAWYCERFQRDMPTFFRGIVIPGAIVGVVLGLIFLEPDVGNALLLGSVSCIILLIAGIRWSYFLPPVMICGALLGFIFPPTRSARPASIPGFISKKLKWIKECRSGKASWPWALAVGQELAWVTAGRSLALFLFITRISSSLSSVRNLG